MTPDGSINTVLWNDFAQRGIHEMAVKSKQITKASYDKAAKYSYWDGFSTGGRQGHKLAQLHPNDFDGILAGAPAFNWTRFITNELYPQIVFQRDLAGVPLTAGQMALLGNAAINACDVVNGQHMGYIPDPSECRYDPTLDPSVICGTSTGANGWKNLSYGQLADAYDRGVILQSSFAHINTDDANLRPFRRSGGKMIIYHGLADVLIMPQGSVNYYERVIREMDGLRGVQKFYRLFLIPGMTHGIGNGTTNPNANPPLPGVAGGDGIADGTSQLYDVLTDWVEESAAPRRIDIFSALPTGLPVAQTRPPSAS